MCVVFSCVVCCFVLYQVRGVNCILLMNCSLIAFLPSHPSVRLRLSQLIVICEGSLRFGKVFFKISVCFCSKPPPRKARHDCRRRTYFGEYLAEKERPPVDNDQRALQVLEESSLVVICEESLFRQGTPQSAHVLLRQPPPRMPQDETRIVKIPCRNR